MRRIIIAMVALFVLASSAMANEFPNLDLSGEMSADQKSYLGVNTDSFKISDIKADYLFIEAYSMYCPVCQRDAPKLNEVYKAVSLMDPNGTIKFVGLGLGNTPFEVEFYRKKYTVEFPLFMDEDYVIHKALGEVPTPTFYIVKMGETLEVLYHREGEAKDKDVLLEAIMKHTGIK